LENQENGKEEDGDLENQENDKE
jgi:hypothetical protein